MRPETIQKLAERCVRNPTTIKVVQILKGGPLHLANTAYTKEPNLICGCALHYQKKLIIREDKTVATMKTRGCLYSQKILKEIAHCHEPH